MHVIAFISQKGGAGKSTLARQLACLAGQPLEYGQAILVDRDPQQTSASWWRRRQEGSAPPKQPELLELGPQGLQPALEALRKAMPGAAVLIDTRPAISEIEAEAAREADQIVVPIRPSADDLEAVKDTLAMLKRMARLERTVLVLNAAKNAQRAQAAMTALARWPVSVCPVVIKDRTAFQDAALQGLWVEELGQPGRQAADELERVWGWLREHARTGGL